MADPEVRPLAALTRRGFLATASLLPLAGFVPGLLEDARAVAPHAPYRFFSPHEGAVLDAATRRLVPGPDDDPAEIGHPGAHEAGVVRYLDTMLSLFEFSPPMIYAGGPWSDRHTSGPNYLEAFVAPDPAQLLSWKQRIAGLRKEYTAGVKLLDAQAGGDFAAASTLQQDSVLAATTDFTALLFGHTIEGMYSIPEYGGNAGRVGWVEVGYPGDIQPKGYTAAEMSEQVVSVIDPVGITAQVLAAFPQVAHVLAAGMAAGGRHRDR